VETAPGYLIFVSATLDGRRQMLAIDPDEVDELARRLHQAKRISRSNAADAVERRCVICKIVKPLSEFYRSRGQPLGIANRCKECDNKHHRERERRNPATRRAKQKRQYARQREKFAARQALYEAVSRGVVVKPNACERCGDECALDGHHEDYTKALEVTWLCRACHAAHHREELAVNA
jgi:ribosomal protein S27AE